MGHEGSLSCLEEHGTRHIHNPNESSLTSHISRSQYNNMIQSMHMSPKLFLTLHFPDRNVVGIAMHVKPCGSGGVC
jgi:hypothetical protein